MNRSQLINFVIDPILHDMKCWSQEAEDLLVMIIAHESAKGEYLHQVQGPAIGIYQMETLTHNDVMLYVKKKRPELYLLLDTWVGMPHASFMAGNLYYATFMARCFFLRFPEAIPTDYVKMSLYAKKYWNTTLGSATPHDYLHAFNTWGLNKPVDSSGEAKA